MALLSRMMRAAAVTGRPEDIHTWVAGRQAGDWAERTIRAGLPRARAAAPSTAAATLPPADPAARLRELTSLRDRGIITDAELEQLRARAGV